ncbi:ribonuclease Z [Gaoshiqia sp. Z1-71]|uniref:ribonuclease Z n=1 Tax=Gaoshiqia hydrogeniformans TaxID=3290090 RepID=UPI003BF7CCBA
MPFQLTILGSSSAMPTSSRYPTAQALNVLGRFFLIDCGEGTQHQIRKNKISFGKLNHILISHLHGDHFFGLIGLISTLILLGRKNDLHIYAHSGLQEYTQFQLNFLGITDPGFRLVFHPLNFKRTQRIYEDEKLSITSFPLKHRIACCGFRFDEKPAAPNIRKDQVKSHRIPVRDIKRIKAGEDFISDDGTRIPNSQLVIAPPKARSYAYCSDTAYHEKIVEAVEGVDMLYHEATFADGDNKLAKETFHSTGSQAARIAQMAQARKLLIGHFSARYKKPEIILNEARSIFPETYVAEENQQHTIVRE